MQHLKDAYASSVQPAADALLKAYPGLLEPHWFTWERFLWASELSYAYTMQVAFCMFGPAFGSQFQSKCESADRDKYCNDRETLRMHESHHDVGLKSTSLADNANLVFVDPCVSSYVSQVTPGGYIKHLARI